MCLSTITYSYADFGIALESFLLKMKIDLLELNIVQAGVTDRQQVLS